LHLPPSDIEGLASSCSPVIQNTVEGWTVTVRLSGPYYAGSNPSIGAKGKQFMALLSTAPEKTNSELFLHIPRTSLGMRHGLTLFREDQFSTPSALYVGKTRKGHAFEMSCGDLDPTKTTHCMVDQRIAKYAGASYDIPAENIPKWREYADSIENYVALHMEIDK